MTEAKKPPERELVADAEIEKSLLGAMLIDPAVIAPVFELIKPHYFAFDAHKTIARAIELVAADGTVDSPSVHLMLKQMGKSQEIGGANFVYDLVKLADTIIPECAGSSSEAILKSALSWAERVRDFWQRRGVLAEARMFVAQLETNSTDDVFEAAKGLASRVEEYRPEPAIQIGGWLDDMCDPVEEPPPIEWLLKDEVTGKGAIPLGKGALYSSGGGTGKTTSLVQLSVAIALGISWCGFTIAAPGCVAICCGESDAQLMRIHFWKACNALGLDEAQRQIAAHNIYAKPLMGHVVNILGEGKSGQYQKTPFLTQFRQELEREADRSKAGFAAVIMDPLSRFAGKDTETDNSAATSYVAAVETLCTLPGNPAVINAHHSSKASGQNGRNDARGVSGIVDGFRSNTTLTRFQYESLVGILMSNTKNNLAPHFADRWLIQQSEKGVGGTLRLATEQEAAVLCEEFNKKTKKRVREPIVKPEKPNLHDAVIKALRDVGGKAKSRNWLFDHHLSGYQKRLVWIAYEELCNQGEIAIDSTGNERGTIRLLNNEEPVQQTLGLEDK